MNNTMDIQNNAGVKRIEKTKVSALRRCMLILSGCIRERESRAIAMWHEALLNSRFREVSYQKVVYQLTNMSYEHHNKNIKDSFFIIKKYAKALAQEQDKIAQEKAKEQKENKGDINIVITEFLKRCVLRRVLNGFSEIKRIWTGELDAKERLESLEKKASIMILENCLSRYVSN